jgi:hypothetical protein
VPANDLMTTVGSGRDGTPSATQQRVGDQGSDGAKPPDCARRATGAFGDKELQLITLLPRALRGTVPKAAGR